MFNILLQDLAAVVSGETLIKAIAINLFVLSMINERLANFLKLNLQAWFPAPKKDEKAYREANALRKGLGETIGNLRVVERDDKECEAVRTKAIQNLAVFCGILVAVLAKADFFTLIRNGRPADAYADLTKTLAWGEIIFGYVLTGLFISLGSKFWHDVLDLILYSSNLKRRLSEDPTFDIDKVEQLTTILSYTDSELAHLALEKHGSFLQTISNVAYVTSGSRRVNGEVKHCVCVYLKDGDTARIPKTLPIQLPNSVSREVTVLVIPNSSLPQVQLASGGIVRRDQSALTGTLCCLLKEAGRKKEESPLYLLTCCHVMTDRRSESPGGIIQNGPNVAIDGQVVGRWQYGLTNFAFDMALVQVADTSREWAIENFQMPASSTVLPASEALVQTHTPVIVVRQSGRNPEPGLIVAYHFERSVSIQYEDSKLDIESLLEIASSDSPSGSNALTAGGDSGALVYEAQAPHRPIGMVIAGNDRASFAIPLDRILTKRSLQLFNA